jgi:hypothetical protein
MSRHITCDTYCDPHDSVDKTQHRLLPLPRRVSLKTNTVAAHPVQKVGGHIDQSEKNKRQYPISDEARYRHVEGIDNIPRRQFWFFHFLYDLVSR